MSVVGKWVFGDVDIESTDGQRVRESKRDTNKQHWNFSINTGIFSEVARPRVGKNFPSLHRFAHGCVYINLRRDACHSLEWYFSRFNCISHQTSPISLSLSLSSSCYCHFRLVICLYTFRHCYCSTVVV